MLMYQNNSSQLNSIQALRAIAFCAIFTYHCGITPGGPWGVSVFFVLSGFISTYRYNSRIIPGSWTFLKNRLHKLYPLHILTMIFVIWREILESHSINVDICRVIADLFLLTSWIPEHYEIAPYNGVAWYLSSIIMSYYLFPMINQQLRRWTKERNVILSIVGIYAVQILLTIIIVSIGFSDSEIRWMTYQHPIFRFGDFLIGCLIGRLYLLNEKKHVNRRLYTLFEMIAIVLSLGSLLIYGMKFGVLGSEYVRYTLLFTPSTCMIVFLFAKMGGCLTTQLTNRITIWVGTISGSGFLIHQVVIYGIKTAIDGGGNWRSFSERILVFLISFVVTAIIALFYDRMVLLVRKMRNPDTRI